MACLSCMLNPTLPYLSADRHASIRRIPTLAPRFSWDTIQPFLHLANASGPFSNEAIAIMARFPMVTIEKFQGPCAATSTPPSDSCHEEQLIIGRAGRYDQPSIRKDRGGQARQRRPAATHLHTAGTVSVQIAVPGNDVVPAAVRAPCTCVCACMC